MDAARLDGALSKHPWFANFRETRNEFASSDKVTRLWKKNRTKRVFTKHIDKYLVDFDKECLKLGCPRSMFYVDVCTAPGHFALYFLKKCRDLRGVGFALPENEGGYEIYGELAKARGIEVHKLNVLTQLGEALRRAREKAGSADFAHVDCFIEHNKNVASFAEGDIELQLNAIQIADVVLRKGGTLVLVHSTKNLVSLVNILTILARMYRRIQVFKHKTIFGYRGVVHVVAKDLYRRVDIDRLRGKGLHATTMTKKIPDRVLEALREPLERQSSSMKRILDGKYEEFIYT